MSTSNRKDSNGICTPIKGHIVRVKRNGKLLERLFTWFKSSSLSRCDSLGLKQFWHLLLLKMLAWNFRQGLSLSDMVDWGSDTRWEKKEKTYFKSPCLGGGGNQLSQQRLTRVADVRFLEQSYLTVRSSPVPRLPEAVRNPSLSDIYIGHLARGVASCS